MKTVWFVKGGVDDLVFETKEAAAAYARLAFPGEDTGQRYARLFFKEFLTLADVKELR